MAMGFAILNPSYEQPRFARHPNSFTASQSKPARA